MDFVLTMYLMVFIGIVIGWLVAILMVSAKMQDMQKEMDIMRKNRNWIPTSEETKDGWNPYEHPVERPEVSE